MTQHHTPRVETGIVQFDDDWPGVFIRGDNAMHYAMCLENPDFALSPSIIRGLIELLKSCQVSDVPSPVRRLTARVKTRRSQ